MGYPDHLNDRFGGALNKVDIAGQTDGQDIKVTELVSSDLNLKTVSHEDITDSYSDDYQRHLSNTKVVSDIKYYHHPPAKAGQFGPKISVLRKKFELSDSVLKSRRCQNKVDLIDKVGTKLAAFGQKDPTRSPMSPLVRRMQQNEKKWSDNFKKKRELSSLKKQKKIEKEAKLKAEDIERKGITKIQMLYDKMMASKSGKITSKICPNNSKKVTKSECSGGDFGPIDAQFSPKTDQMDFQSDLQLKEKPMEDDIRKREGLLQSSGHLANLKPKRIVFDNFQGKVSKLGRTEDNLERATKMQDKISIFEDKIRKMGQSTDAVEKAEKGGPPNS